MALILNQPTISGSTTDTNTNVGFTTLTIGSRGDAVKTLQTNLARLGYDVGSPDGIFGNKTATALKQFQSAYGLTSDSIYGAKTDTALSQVLAGKLQPIQQTSPVIKPSQQIAGAVTDAGTNALPVNQTSMAQPDFYQVAPTTPTPSISDLDRGTAPPTSGQLGAQAKTFDPYSMYKPDVSALPDVQQKSFIERAQELNAQTRTFDTGYQPLNDALAKSEAEQRALRDSLARGGTATPSITDMDRGDTPVSTQPISVQPTLGWQPVAEGTPLGKKDAVATELATQTASVDKTIPITPIRTSGGVGGGSVSAQAPSGTVGATGAITPEQQKTQDDLAISIAETANLTTMSNDLFERLNTMTADWNPETDPDYTRDAQILENKVAQMMVARGGLYSSVARAALQSSLIDLQSNYRKQAFERFITERDFIFKQLAFVSERIDAEFNKAMALKNYDLAVAKEQFDQKMAIAQFKADQQYKNAQLAISRANASAAREAAAYQRQMAEAAYNQQQQYNSLKQYEAQLITGQALLTQAQKEYIENGYLTSQSQSYLGLKQSPSSNEFFQATWNKQKQLESGWETYRQNVIAFGDAETTLEAYRSVLPVSKEPTMAEYEQTSTTYNPQTLEPTTTKVKYNAPLVQ